MATTQPTNASEWQLYRVLQRANLLQYYDTFIAQGGDDVQQLCEAGEEEFLEIMALVGMASKPLHVRRLQKALQEWVSNPGDTSFQSPVVNASSPAPGSISAVVRDQALGFSMHSTPPTSVVNAPTWNPQPAARSVSPAAPEAPSPSSGSPQSDIKDFKDIPVTMSTLQEDYSQSLCGYPLQSTNQHSSSPLPTPVLVESQINAIAEAAAALAKELPPFEPKELNMKKQINRDIQTVMQLSEDDPNRMEELRKYAAIYGRFDSKRKNDRPMSLHEISVNEAAAQLCRHMSALLTRREDLFPLARQVVRDSGYQYSKGHSRAADVVTVSKKPRLDPVFQRMHDTNPKTVKAELDKIHREERMTKINRDLTRIKQEQEEIRTQIAKERDAQNFTLVQKLQTQLESLTAQQLHLLTEQSEVIRKQKRSDRYQLAKSGRPGNGQYSGDDDFTDSSNFPSGGSSPQNDSQDGVDFDFTKAALYAAQFRSQTAKQLVQETLFDEGLRIAQQYGMADFAEELKELQSQRVPSNRNGQGSDSELSDSQSDSGDGDDEREDGEGVKEDMNDEKENERDLKEKDGLEGEENKETGKGLESEGENPPKTEDSSMNTQEISVCIKTEKLTSNESEISMCDNSMDCSNSSSSDIARIKEENTRNSIVSEPLQNGN